MRCALGLVLSLLGLAALPAGAAATGSLTLNGACFNAGDTITATGQGWTPNDAISIGDPTGDFVANAIADTTGLFTTTFTAPVLPSGTAAVQSFTATATDTAATGQTATASFFDVQPGVNVSLSGPLTTKVLWTVAGGSGGQVIYGHWIWHHELQTTVRMGTVPGACGLVSRRLRRLPAPTHNGQWTVQFDTSKTYHAKKHFIVTLTFHVSG
jgi:hypothetical protein